MKVNEMNQCEIHGCRNLEWKCADCGESRATAKIGAQWISVKDHLPNKGQQCWIYGTHEGRKDPEVFEGNFTSSAFDFRKTIGVYGIGWEYYGDYSNYVMLDQVTHWMPYTTPEPPCLSG